MFKVQSCFVNTSCFEQIVQLDFRNCDVVKPEEEEEEKKIHHGQHHKDWIEKIGKDSTVNDSGTHVGINHILCLQCDQIR